MIARWVSSFLCVPASNRSGWSHSLGRIPSLLAPGPNPRGYPSKTTRPSAARAIIARESELYLPDPRMINCPPPSFTACAIIASGSELYPSDPEVRAVPLPLRSSPNRHYFSPIGSLLVIMFPKETGPERRGLNSASFLHLPLDKHTDVCSVCALPTAAGSLKLFRRYNNNWKFQLKRSAHCRPLGAMGVEMRGDGSYAI